MNKIGNFTLTSIIIGSFVLGRLSKPSTENVRLDGIMDGINEGYARALIELYLLGKITREDVVEFSKRI